MTRCEAVKPYGPAIGIVCIREIAHHGYHQGVDLLGRIVRWFKTRRTA